MTDKYGIKKKILNSLLEKEIFIGYYMLCRYINGKGYKRYGCNAGYIKGKTNGRDRLSPCKILCKSTHIRYGQIRYWCNKLLQEKKIYLEKRLWYDSINPTVGYYRNTERMDLFVFIALSKECFERYTFEHELVHMTHIRDKGGKDL